MSLSCSSKPREIHVSIHGTDAAEGTPKAPLRTIQAAAQRAQPGDTVTVHAGVYRERVNPPRGGVSEDCRITYRAAAGERVVITGSEPARGWEREAGDVWRVRVPNAFFGAFNPFREVLSGHWFLDKDRTHHRGSVYLNGHWLAEAASKDQLQESATCEPFWFAEVDDAATTIWAQFPGVDPAHAEVEIAVRPTVFYPSRPGCDFITVRGFTLLNAATPWSPPTTEQIGLLGVNWSRGWIIENNTVRYSLCAGITLGKYDDPEDFGDRPVLERTDGKDTYHGTIERALRNGWAVGRVGDHVVRNNTISHCEMAGIAGSLGALRSRVHGNVIHDIHMRRLFFGYEMAGIKFHGAIDAEISGNRIFRCYRGIWLDWMSQGTRVTSNLLYDNGDVEDFFPEVNHGPFLVDHNLFLSAKSLVNWSHGGAYAHNLFAGAVALHAELERVTPYHPAHSTAVVGLLNIETGDDRLFNNLILDARGLSGYNEAKLPLSAEDNLYLAGAEPCVQERDPLRQPDYDRAELRVEDCGDEVYLHLPAPAALPGGRPTRIVDSQRLGRARVPDLPYEQADGSPLRLDADYFGRPHADAPAPGPFAEWGGGLQRIKVWPRA